jgi:iron complex outermembrane recepter protein
VKVGFLSLMLASVGAFVPVAAQAVAQSYQLDIPRQQLDAALKDLAQQTGLQIARFSDTPGGGAFVGPVSGVMPVTDALKTLLAPNKLTYKIVNDHTIAVMTLSTAAAPSESTKPSPSSQSSSPAADQQLQEGKKSSSQEFRLAQVAQGAAGPSAVAAIPGKDEDKNKLSEIIVTAEKRSERLQDTPVPVSVIDADSLLAANQLRLQDYFTSVPGLMVQSAGRAFQLLSIRGVAPVGGNPTVGITVDDVPYGSSTGIGGGLVTPDIDPGDLAQVEVLRGPQGTLYGTNSIGGLIKFVTVDPSTEGMSGRLQAGTSTVYNGAELGYSARGSFNLPLSNTLAVNGSAFTRIDPGFIDDAATGQKGVNEQHASGGRLAALWKPSDSFSLKLAGLIEETKRDGADVIEAEPPSIPPYTLQSLQQSNLRGTGRDDRRIENFSATLNATVGVAKITAITGYNVNRFFDSLDLTYAFGGLAQQFYQVSGASTTIDSETKKLTQEVRVSIPIGTSLEWLVGGFYTHESTPYALNYPAVNPATGAEVGQILYIDDPSTYEEYAGFTDLKWQLTERFNIQFGGRETQYNQSYSTVYSGPYIGATPLVFPEAFAKANAFTFLVTPQFKISQNLMVYARGASGFRAGGPNTDCVAIGVECQYKSDTTKNYELGIKGSGLNDTLSFDASLYHIDWRNIQLQLVDPTTLQGYTGNGGRAKSQGLEFSIESKPLSGLTLSGWLALSDAVLTQAIPQGGPGSAYGVAGDRLPYNSRFSGRIAAQQDFPLTSDLTGFVAGAVSYYSAREGLFGTFGATERLTFPAYAQTDLRAGVTYESWMVNLYANNIANKLAFLDGGAGYGGATFGYQVITPRTVGLSVTKRF